jgi:hypothetical protein
VNGAAKYFQQNTVPKNFAAKTAALRTKNLARQSEPRVARVETTSRAASNDVQNMDV